MALLVGLLCEQRCFLPLLRAFELFLPDSPFLHCIRFLQVSPSLRQLAASEVVARVLTVLEVCWGGGGRSIRHFRR